MNTQFSMISNRKVTGDFFKTTGNKFIATVSTITGTSQNFVHQYDYTAQLLDVEIPLGPTLSNSFGIFEDSGIIYLGRGTTPNGEIYSINSSPVGGIYNCVALSVSLT